MTRQYLAGELSVLLGHLQAAATTKGARRDAWSPRQAAETQPVTALASVTVAALALTEHLCWDSLTRGDMAAFNRQAAVCAEVHVASTQTRSGGGIIATRKPPVSGPCAP